jgi:monoamine oxidase
MRSGSSAAARALARARAAARYARRTGCDIGEATSVLAESGGDPAGRGHPGRAEAGDGLSRRQVLRGAAGAGLAVAVPAGALGRSAVAQAALRPDPQVVIIGSGIAGLGCAFRLARHGIPSQVYEYNPVRAGGRIRTLRGFFAAGQYAEEHGEFISSEHTGMRRLAAGLGLTLDNVNAYPPHTRAGDYRFRFDGRFWPQAALDREWHDWGFRLFHDAAFVKAPWPTLYNRHNRHTASARRWDHTPATEWIEQHIPGGLSSDFGRLCVAILLDEYGGPVDQQSALNLIYLLGTDDSVASGRQPKNHPVLSATDEKWHVRGGTDQLIRGLLGRLPPGAVRLGERLEAVRSRGHGRYTCTFSRGGAIHEVHADHVVLALPFTKLREVDLRGITLPPPQLRAIREEPLGTNAKIQMQFSRRVWNAEHWTGNLYTDGLVQGGWETTVDQPGEPGILIALPGGAAGADIGRRYGLTADDGPAPPAMARDFLASFNQIFPGTREAYNGRAYYAWSAGDPHIGGAYSYLRTGQYTAFNGIQGRRSGNLHFAGEHTSVDFQGYMEGALRSGYRCAAEIAWRRTA